MPKYTDFESFARDLYLTASKVPLDGRRTVYLEPTHFMKRAEKVLDYFAEAHISKINSVLWKSLQNIQVLGTEEEFMRYAIPRCLNLIDNEKDFYFYSLMLVAAFIKELQTFVYDDKMCYRFELTGYKCLVAVFKREFEGSFEKHGGFKALDNYFRTVLKAIKTRGKYFKVIEILNGWKKDKIRRVAEKIKICGDGIDQDFHLNDYELSVAEDVEASRNEWFNPTTVDENDSPLEFEWTLVSNDRETNYKSVYDRKQDLIKTTRVDSGIHIENYASSNYKSIRLSPEIIWSDSDEDYSGDSESEPGKKDLDVDSSEDSESEQDMESVVEFLSSRSFQITYPDEFFRIMSSRQCEFCGTHCYQYANYTFKKYGNLALRTSKKA